MGHTRKHRDPDPSVTPQGGPSRRDLLGLSLAAGGVVAVLLWPILSVRRQAA